MRGRSRIQRLTWYTKPDCRLCDDAWPHVVRAARLLCIEVAVVDVTGDPGLTAGFGIRVPVLAAGDSVLAEGPIGRGEAWRVILRARLRMTGSR